MVHIHARTHVLTKLSSGQAVNKKFPDLRYTLDGTLYAPQCLSLCVPIGLSETSPVLPAPVHALPPYNEADSAHLAGVHSLW